MSDKCFEDIVDELHERDRLDVYLTNVLDDATRSAIKKFIKGGRVTVNGGVCKRPGRSMTAGDRVSVEVPPPRAELPVAEDIPLDILHEDADVIVVNKPAGLVVHPAPGHYTGTLVNAVLHHCPDFASTGSEAERPGIVHRLDRFTSGVMVVAKSPRAFTNLAKQAAAHEFERQYLTLVRGEFPEERGRINASIGRSLRDPARMSVTGINGRDAVTNFRVCERFGVASLVAVRLETGRTHQVRVHMRFAGHPVLGDPAYGVAHFGRWHVSPETRAALEALNGQALHAERLGFTHPATGEMATFTAPPPADFQAALEALRAECARD
ncbi:MAG: RluA family pseudouridine synthase [Nitrospiraceae bacterium]|nr:RluA family pseudouridine synthase [Nitrospiraceae bacterium]